MSQETLPKHRPTPFAPWIPAVLDQIAALASLPDPPSSYTITESRKIAVNLEAGLPAPRVEAWPADDGVGVSIRWESCGWDILPEAKAIVWSD